MLNKKNFTKLKTIFIYISLFLLADVFYSNFIYKENLKYNCYKYFKDFHLLQKNCKAKEKWVKKASAYNVFTDENGFRFQGEKIKKETQKTAVFLGDSFTYGMGLEYSKTFVGLIDKNEKNFLIKNLGVQGYSPSVYLYQLKKLRQKQIYPKKIFVALDISDVFEEASIWTDDKNFEHPVLIKKRDMRDVEKEFSFKDKNFKASRFLARKINNTFRDIRLKKEQIENKKKIPGNSGWGNFIFLDISKTDQTLWEPLGFKKALRKIESKFIEMSKISKELNAEFYIIIYPWPDTLFNGQANFNWENYAVNICKISNCKKLINLFPDFKEIRNSSENWLTDIFIAGDLHITHSGQKIIAQKILSEAFNE